MNASSGLQLVALGVFMVVLTGAVWRSSGLPFMEWLRRELRLARVKTWQGDHIVNPALGSTRENVAVAQMEALQYAAGERLRRDGRALTSAKVIPIRRRGAP